VVERVIVGALEYRGIVKNFSPNAKKYLTYTALTSISFSVFHLIFNLYIYSLGYQQDFIGLLNGLPSIVILAIGLPVGMAADRYGYKTFLVTGSVLSTLAVLALAFFEASPGLIGASLALGVAGALTWVIGAPMMAANSNDKERVYLFSVNFALMMGAGFVGSMIGGMLPEYLAVLWGSEATATGPLRGAFLTVAFFNALAIFPALRMTNVKPVMKKRRLPLPQGKEEWALFSKLLLPSMFVSFGAGAMVTFFQLFFNLRFELSTGSIGYLFAFSSIVTAIATLASPLLAKRFGKVRTVFYTELASIPFLLILAYSYNLGVVIVAYYMRSALMNMSGPVQMTFSMEQVNEDQRATLTSLNAMLGSLGRGGLGPLVSGYVQVRYGFSEAFTLTTICYLIGAFLFYYFFRHIKD